MQYRKPWLTVSEGLRYVKLTDDQGGVRRLGECADRVIEAIRSEIDEYFSDWRVSGPAPRETAVDWIIGGVGQRLTHQGR